MDIPSRFPGGRPGVCSNCAGAIPIQPMVLYGDVSCQECSEPLWFLNLSSETRMFRQSEADEVKDRVRHIVADEMDISPDVVPTDWTEVRELIVDSLDAIEILTMLEEEFSGKVVAGRIPHLRR